MHPDRDRTRSFSTVTSRRLLLRRGLWLGVGAALTGGVAVPRRAAAVNYLEDPWLNLTLRYSDNMVEWDLGCYIGFTSEERLRADNYGARFRLYVEFWEQDQGRDSYLDGDDGLFTLPSNYFGGDDNPLRSVDAKGRYRWWGDRDRDAFDRDSASEDEIYALFILRDLEREETLQALQSSKVSIRA